MFTTFFLFTSILVNTSVCGMQLSGLMNSNKASLHFLFKAIFFSYSCQNILERWLLCLTTFGDDWIRNS